MCTHKLQSKHMAALNSPRFWVRFTHSYSSIFFPTKKKHNICSIFFLLACSFFRLFPPSPQPSAYPQVIPSRHCPQLKRSQTFMGAHVIFQVQISRTSSLQSFCLGSGRYSLKPNFNKSCQYASRHANSKWDKLLRFYSPGWHVSREACNVYTWLFVMKYYLSCDMVIS